MKSTVPATRAALIKATCNGYGSIFLPLPGGGSTDPIACAGCRSCTPTAPRELPPIPAAMWADDDEAF